MNALQYEPNQQVCPTLAQWCRSSLIHYTCIGVAPLRLVTPQYDQLRESNSNAGTMDQTCFNGSHSMEYFTKTKTSPSPCALSASPRKKVYVKWIRRSHRIYSHHTRGTNVAKYWTHYRYKLLLIKFLTNVEKVIVGMTSKAHFLHHFFPRVILLCLYREPQPHKTQKAPHNKPQTPSTDNPNPKT